MSILMPATAALAALADAILKNPARMTPRIIPFIPEPGGHHLDRIAGALGASQNRMRRQVGHFLIEAHRGNQDHHRQHNHYPSDDRRNEQYVAHISSIYSTTRLSRCTTSSYAASLSSSRTSAVFLPRICSTP